MAIGAEEWDEYRRRYVDLTPGELADWHSRLWKDTPKQQHFDIEAARLFFDCMSDYYQYTVHEIGGWDGELAKAILDGNSNISSWCNTEICNEAQVHTICDDPRYHVHRPGPCPFFANVMVASHVLEHMCAPEIREVTRRACSTANWIYIDCPPPDPVEESTSMHIVANPWKHILPMPRPWRETGSHKTARWFTRCP